MIYYFQNFSIDLANAIDVKIFKEEKLYGVSFKNNQDRFSYEIIHNLAMGYRIFIYDGNGYLKDIPFHKGTEGFLPDGIKVTWKTNE